VGAHQTVESERPNWTGEAGGLKGVEVFSPPVLPTEVSAFEYAGPTSDLWAGSEPLASLPRSTGVRSCWVSSTGLA
jgi:hypothetical protein